MIIGIISLVRVAAGFNNALDFLCQLFVLRTLGPNFRPILSFIIGVSSTNDLKYVLFYR
jgi:hypothetical protein